jgi:hypothetical protein
VVNGCVNVLLTKFIDAQVLTQAMEKSASLAWAHGLMTGTPVDPDLLRSRMREVFTALSAARLPEGPPVGIPHISELFMPQVEWAQNILEKHGWKLSASLQDATHRLTHGPCFLIHGDASGDNMMYRTGENRGIVLFDGGFIGPAAWDPAQAIAKLVPHDRTDEFVEMACEIDRRWQRADLESFLGVTRTLHAAYTLARGTIPGEAAQVKHVHGDWLTGRPGVAELVDDANARLKRGATLRPAIAALPMRALSGEAQLLA